MSGTFPTSPGFSALSFENNRPTLVNASLSGRRAVRQIGSQYFTFTVSMPPMNQNDAMDIFAFLQKQKGSFETFQIKIPLQNRGAEKSSTAVKVVGSHSAADSTIALDGFAASTTGVLKAGDLIKFAGHTKVYMVQSDIDSDGSGAATVSIEPGIVSTLADNEVVTMNQPDFTVYLVSDVVYQADRNSIFNISFDVREVIS
jgi:hypothetical protein|tara:strand:+ start:11467 stop:12069 length:603 start_codon:yes stop_codon:yes gene_type:complete